MSENNMSDIYKIFIFLSKYSGLFSDKIFLIMKVELSEVYDSAWFKR